MAWETELEQSTKYNSEKCRMMNLESYVICKARLSRLNKYFIARVVAYFKPPWTKNCSKHHEKYDD
jgi:hypothetical protein